MVNLPPGQMLGPYKIVNQLGQGGMATVYKAYHASMDRYVALKVLSHQFAFSQEFYGRFQHEARLIAKLEHPHILPVHDFGESDGIPYLVMRYLEAGTLKDRMEDGPLPLNEVDRIFTQLMLALGYAHENGVIHRDLKPSNAMLDKRGEVFLTDFGIAKLVEGSPQFTATGAITGTPAYMSPEQAQGLKIDPRSDLYSMGIVLFEMLTGRVPYEAETPLAVILKQIQEPLPPLSLVKPDIHPAIEAVVLKALAKDPNDRYNNTEEFLGGWKRAIQEAGSTTGIQTNLRPLPTPRPVPSRPIPVAPVSPQATSSVSASRTSQAVPTSTLPPISEPAQTTAKKRISSRMWLGGFAGCLTVLLTLCACVTIVRINQNNKPTPPPDIISLAPDPSTGSTSTEAGTTGSWKSWTSENTGQVLAIKGEEILAGGGDGVTFWNTRDGSHQHFTIHDGLPGSSVNAILVDEDNSLWFGTDEGIGRYDGKQWQYYGIDQGLDNTYISSITRVGDTLWAGTFYGGNDGSGLNRFNGEVWEQVPGFPSMYEEDPSQNQPGTLSYNVYRVLGDGSDNVWVATTAGIGRYDGQTWTVFDQSSGLPEENISALFFDQDDQLWVGTYSGYVAKFNGLAFDQVRNLNEISIYEIYAITQDQNGLIWFAGEGGVANLNPDNYGWNVFSMEDSTFPSYAATAVLIDGDGILYFGTWTDGLIRYDGVNFTVQKAVNTPRFSSYTSVVADPNGKLWFVEEYGYLDSDILDPVNELWSEAPYQDNCCWQPMIWSESGDLWAGGYNGLWIISPDHQIVNFTTREGLPSDNVSAIAFTPDGHSWIGTDSGLAAFSGNEVTAVLTAGSGDLSGDSIYFLQTTSDGSLWAGTDTGLSQRTPSGEWIRYHSGQTFGTNLEWVSTLVEDQQGAIWVGTWGEGIYRLLNGNWVHYSYNSGNAPENSDYITSSGLGLDGSLWFGVYWNGVIHLQNEQWVSYTVDDGLIYPNINDLLVDQTGDVWFATSGGISRYRP